MQTRTVIFICAFLSACQTRPVIEQAHMLNNPESADLQTTVDDSPEKYLRMIEEQPGIPGNWLLLGNSYAMSNDMDAAIIAYREALALDRGFSKAWYNLGVARLRQAADSFNQIRQYADPADPTLIQGQRLLDGILELIRPGDEQTENSLP